MVARGSFDRRSRQSLHFGPWKHDRDDPGLKKNPHEQKSFNRRALGCRPWHRVCRLSNRPKRVNTKHLIYAAIAAVGAYYFVTNSNSASGWPGVTQIYYIGYNFGAGNGFGISRPS
jgi:hypothetical protein